MLLSFYIWNGYNAPRDLNDYYAVWQPLYEGMKFDYVEHNVTIFGYYVNCYMETTKYGDDFRPTRVVLSHEDDDYDDINMG